MTDKNLLTYAKIDALLGAIQDTATLDEPSLLTRGDLQERLNEVALRSMALREQLHTAMEKEDNK